MMNENISKIVILGLENAGKTSLVRRIVQSEESLTANIPNEPMVEFLMWGNLNFITWDLEETIPQTKSLWKRSILGVDALFFIVDSTDKEAFDLNRKLLFELVELNSPIRLLLLATKSDLLSSTSLEELTTALDLLALEKENCQYNLIKCSSYTGEGIFAIRDWLDKILFKRKERIINYIEIKASLILDEESEAITEALLVTNPNISLLTAFRELKRKAKIFSRMMRIHGSGEEVIELGDYKVALVKEKSLIITLLIGLNDSVSRAFEIAHSTLKLVSSSKGQEINIKRLIGDLYPLDIPQ